MKKILLALFFFLSPLPAFADVWQWTSGDGMDCGVSYVNTPDAATAAANFCSCIATDYMSSYWGGGSMTAVLNSETGSAYNDTADYECYLNGSTAGFHAVFTNITAPEGGGGGGGSGTYSDVFTSVDLTTIGIAVISIAVLLVSVWLVFAALRLGKRTIGRF